MNHSGDKSDDLDARLRRKGGLEGLAVLFGQYGATINYTPNWIPTLASWCYLRAQNAPARSGQAVLQCCINAIVTGLW